MRPSHIKAAIMACVSDTINRPLFIWGPPGVGKSDVVRAASVEMRVELVDFRAALRDAVDIMGLPFATEHGDEQPRTTHYAMPAGLPHDPDWRGIVFLDEMNSAPPATQAALYQLVLDRRVGDYVLPKGARIVAAGNRQNDRGVVHRMPDPLVDRFFHVDFEVSLDDWCNWARAASVATEVIAYLRMREANLHNHDTTRQCHAFSTPRGWADVSKVLTQALPKIVENELIRGRVGDGAASEFITFLDLVRNAVSPDEVLRDPKKAEVPKKVDVLYALAEALARRADVGNFGRILVYAERMPMEYAQSLVTSARTITPELVNTNEYIQWAIKHGNKS